MGDRDGAEGHCPGVTVIRSVSDKGGWQCLEDSERGWQCSGHRDEGRQYLGTRLAVPREAGSA